MVGVLATYLGYSSKCTAPNIGIPGKPAIRGQRRGGRYTDTRNREILDKLIREKVDDVEILGTK